MTDTVRIRFDDHPGDVVAPLGSTLLDVALANGHKIDHACGGVCACSTCHVKIARGANALSPASEDEEDQLDTARGVELNSRLACQARLLRVPAEGVVEVCIPRWNVNLISEGH